MHRRPGIQVAAHVGDAGVPISRPRAIQGPKGIHRLSETPDAKLPLAGRRDFIAGVFLIAIAAAIVYAAFDLRIGTPARMGPGFLPLALGILLGVAGFAVAFAARTSSEPLPSFRNLRPLAALLFGFLAFAFLIDFAGLALAAFAAVFSASFATPGRRWLEAAVFSAALAAFAALLFVTVLGMPLQVWP